MKSLPVPVEALGRLEPLSRLSGESLREISSLCYVERISRNLDPFRLQGLEGQIVYLIKGELKLDYPDTSSDVLVGGTDAASRALDQRKPRFVSGKAITDIELVRIDEEMLDIMLTWDQLAGPTPSAKHSSADPVEQTDWRTMTGLFAAHNLTRGAFAALPPAHIEALLLRFERIKVSREQIILTEGEVGDYYYLIESGRCTVTRQVGGTELELAELKAGDAFGEEALLADARRNATVVMKTDGVLLRLAKRDFLELLKEPLTRSLNADEARAKIAAGAIWLDVRFPAEYRVDKLPGAINIPLDEIRHLYRALDRGKEYIAYCQSGRRSSAAAFLLSQQGFQAYLLAGGLRRERIDPNP